MMAFTDSFFVHMPNWFGFLVLIAIWIVFRGILLRWRRGAMERMRWRSVGQMQQPQPPGPVEVPLMHGQVRCPRCSASAPGTAAFCPHCGLALGLVPPPPIPQVQLAQRPTRSPWLLFVYVLLGVIGLAAYAYWRSGGWDAEQAATPQPEIRHTHTHDYRWPH
jgi:hypothetical protein